MWNEINQILSLCLQSAVAPSSPSPSDRSLPPFSSGSSISETTSTGSASSSMVAPPNGLNHHHHSQQHNNLHSLKNSLAQKNSLLQHSLHNSLIIPEDEQLDSASALAVCIANGKHFFFHNSAKNHRKKPKFSQNGKKTKKKPDFQKMGRMANSCPM